MPTPQEQLDEANKKAEAARKKADDLAAERDAAQKARHKGLEAWRVPHESVVRDEAKAVALELEAKSLDDKAADPEDDLEEGESVEAARLRLSEAAKAKRKEAADFNLESRKKYAAGLRDKYRELRTAHRDARSAAADASREAEDAENEAVDCEQSLYHAERFFAWDGIVSSDGRNNRGYPETVASKRAKARRAAKSDEVVEAQAARLTREEESELSAKLDKKNVWVRIVSCPDELVPIAGRLVAKIDVGRIFLVRSMMIRVYDKDGGKAVYQEILDADAVDRLPRTAPIAERHQDALPKRIDACDDHARPEKGPYRLVVWVSKTDGAFDGLALDVDPKERIGAQVHDQSPRKTGEVASSGVGVNQAKVHPIHLVTLAVMDQETHHGTDREARPLDAKIDEIEKGIEEANKKLGRKRAGELRVFLGPEWNFQKKPYPWTNTPDDKDAVVDALETSSAKPACSQWLILPGTILWGVPSPKTGCLAVINTLVCLYEGSVVHTYNKKQWGSDTYLSQFIHDQCLLETEADGWERRHNKLNDRKVPKSIATSMGSKGWSIKEGTVEVDVMQKDVRWRIRHTPKGDARPTYVVRKPGHRKLDVVPGEVFAMTLPDGAWATYFDALSRTDFDKPNCFTHAGLKLGVDVCADHKGAQCAVYYKKNGEPGNGAGKDKGVDLYFFTSSNVDRELWKVPARKGGYFFHSDGGNYGVIAYAITGREISAGDVGQVFIDARAACDPTQRGADYASPKNPGASKDAPTVSGDRLEPETIKAAGVSFQLYRIVVVDP